MLLASDQTVTPLQLTYAGAFIFFLITAVLLSAALFEQYQRSPDKANFFNPKKFPLVVAAIGLFVLSLIVVNMAFPKKSFSNPLACARYAETHGDPDQATACYHTLIMRHPLEPDYHFGYVKNHFAQKREWRDSRGSKHERLDYPVEEMYEGLAQSADVKERDVAHLGLALYHYHQNSYQVVWEQLERITDDSLKYVNYLRGLISRGSIEYLRAEAALPHGYKSGAYTELARIYLTWSMDAQLVELSRNKDAIAHLEPHLQRLLYFKANNPGGYLKSLLREFGYRATPVILIAVLLITVVWLMFLSRLDVFEPERWRWIGAVMLLEAVLALAVFPLSDVYHFKVEHVFTGTRFEMFASYVFQVGLIEEAVKIAPLLLLLVFTKNVNEPFDYLFFGSVSALTFGAMENIIYFSEYEAGIIHGRALTAVVGHMIFSSVCAYVLMFFKYRLKTRWFLGLVPGLLLAALIHGVWNALAVTTVYVLVLIYFVLLLRVWARVIANALNNSEFFTYERKLNTARLQQILVFGLTVILVFEYFTSGIEFDRTYANSSLVASLITGSFLTVFLTIKLSNLDLAKGYWGGIDLEPGLLRDVAAPHNLVGSEVEFQPYEHNPYLIRILEDFPQGTIINRVMVGGHDPNWYLVRMYDNLMLKDCVRNHLLVKFISKNPHLGTDFNMLVNVLVMNREEDLTKEKIPANEVVEFGWAYLSLREPGKAATADDVVPEQREG